MRSSLTAFAYHEPTSLERACGMLADLGPTARVLAGGCDVVPSIRRRVLFPTAVVSIARIPGLDDVLWDGKTLRILPMASLRRVELSADVWEHFRSLYEGVHSIASVQVKTTGTLVGNLCVATPASDISPPLMVLGATAHIRGPEGVRVIEVEDLFAGTKRTSLGRGEIVAAIHVQAPPPATGSAFAKLTRTAADCAKLNVAARVTLDHGRAIDVRVALGSVAATPVRAPEAESLLVASDLDDTLIARAADAAVEHVHPITDLRSTATYRRQALHVLFRRVLAAARDRARGQAA